MKVIELSKQKNIRDIGGMITKDGHHIKYGKLYRGNALHRVNEDDIKIIDSFNLTDIIDFRSRDEFEAIPDYVPLGTKLHNIPVLRVGNDNKERREMKGTDGNLLWFLEDNVSGHDHLMHVYEEFVTTKEGRDAFKEFFRIILQDNVVSYFHCSQGKDRTGFAAYLTEIALGVSHEDALADYLLSNVAMKSKIDHLTKMVEDKPFYNETYQQSLIDVFSTKEDYLNIAIKAMNEKYGGTLNFIKNVLEVDIDKLKELYLE